MAYVVKVGGRPFSATGQRLTYVRKPMLFGRWIETSRDKATHVIHMWLPDWNSAWEFTLHERDW